MRIPFEMMSENAMKYKRKDYENSPIHAKFEERLRKTLYFGRLPSTDRSSLPVTDVAVEYFQHAAPRELGRLDKDGVSSMSRRACISPYAMMIGMIYIKRLKNKNPEYLMKIASSDLFLVSMMLASKFHYDEGVDEEVFNDEWAESAHMDLDELNELEREFLSAIEWHLFVQQEEFCAVLQALEQRIALSQCVDRGWFSYTDIDVLLHDDRQRQFLKLLVQQLCKVIAVLSAAYIASMLTMVLSTIAMTTLPSFIMTQSCTLQLNAIKQRNNIESLPTVVTEHFSQDALNMDNNSLTAMPTTDEVLHAKANALTLINLSNTFVHFVYGVLADSDFHQEQDYPKPLSRNLICTPGYCDTNIKSICRNVTSDRTDSLSYDSVTKEDLLFDNAAAFDWNILMEQGKLFHCDASLHCWYTGKCQCCCGSEKVLDTLDKSFTDISIGFGTNPQAIVVSA